MVFCVWTGRRNACSLVRWLIAPGTTGVWLLSMVHDTPLPFANYQYFWGVIDAAGKDMGFTSLYSKMKLPTPLMTLVGHVCDFISWSIGRQLRVNTFTVSVNGGVLQRS